VASSLQISRFVEWRDVRHRKVTADARSRACLIQPWPPAGVAARDADTDLGILNAYGGNLTPAPTFGCELSIELGSQHVAHVEHQASSRAAWGLGADGAPIHRRRSARVLPTARRPLPRTTARAYEGLAYPGAAGARTTSSGWERGSRREPPCQRVCSATGYLPPRTSRRGLAHLRPLPCAPGPVALPCLLSLMDMAGEI
jgi:hypothetical protein